MLLASRPSNRAGIESLETRQLFAVVVSQVADLSGTSQGINYTFDSPVSTADVLNSLSLWTNGGTIPREQLAVTATGANQVRVTFPGVNSNVAGMLGDGNYEAILEDGAGSPFSTRSVLPFFYYYGDVNFDRRVDFYDLVAVAQNYNTTGKTNAQGDVNYDHAVEFIDLVIIAKKYDRGILAPGITNPVSVGQVTNNSVTLSFAPPTDTNTGVASTLFTGFHVYRSSDGVNYAKVSSDNDPTLKRNGAATYSWTNTGLTAGTTYTYLVAPYYNTTGQELPVAATGDWYKSNEASATTSASAAVTVSPTAADKSLRGDKTTRRASAWSELA